MFLYHGTSLSRANQILKEGIRPRSHTGLSNWYECPSCEDAIYLTDAYPIYFGNVAAAKAGEDEAAYLVIDSTQLDPAYLAADEDAIEQALRQVDNDPLKGMEMEERVLTLREQLIELVDNGFSWEWSLKVLGNCTYHGTIPTTAIVKVVHWKPEGPMQFACDPTITVMNYTIMGSFYRQMAAKLAGITLVEKEAPFSALFPADSIDALIPMVTAKDNPSFSTGAG